MRDAYAGLNRYYLAMHTQAEAAGEDVSDPVMGEWFAKNLHSGARILDAGCGLGFDVLALHRGLPARAVGRKWMVYASDYSADMLTDASRVGVQAGMPASRYRRASFASLPDHTDWQALMDAVVVNYAIYTQPSADTEYERYLKDSLGGLAAMLAPGGSLLLNLRDWSSLRAFDSAGNTHVVMNVHGGIRYQCNYTWEFGGDNVHCTTLRMQEADGQEHTTAIWFAERSPAQIELALRAAGLTVTGQGYHGEGASAFHTLIARKDLE